MHGLTHWGLLEAPHWPDVHTRVQGILSAASVIVAYNADFDKGVLHNTCCEYGLPSVVAATQDRWHCAMEWYAQWWGDWSEYHGSYRWQPLGGGHRAREDCLTVLARLRTMAGPATPSLPC